MDTATKYQFICYSVAGVAALVAKLAWQSGLRKRPKEYAMVAQRLGLSFRAEKDFELAARWHFLDALSGFEPIKFAFNILEGRRDGQRVLVFDYHFKDESRGGWSNPKIDRTIMIMELEGVSFPKLFISPQIARSIRFESAEFSRKYGVVSDDKKFAYDVCNPQMIEYLIDGIYADLEINGNALVLKPNRLLDPDFIEFELNHLVKIRSLLPEYLFEKT